MSVQIPAGVESRTVDLDGPTHYFDFGGNPDGPLLVGVHGLGGAAWNWAAVAPLLTEQARFIAVDLAGHGRTPAGERRTTVPANRRLLDRFLRKVASEPVVLVGNSMGGAISLLEAAAAPELVRGLVLVDPALPAPLKSRVDPVVAARFALVMIPGLGEAAIARRRRRLTAEQQVHETLTLCCVDRKRIPADVVQLGIALTEERYADEYGPRDFLVAARSVIKLLTRRRRITEAMRSVTAPVLLIHGDSDRLVKLETARAVAAMHPAWQLAVATDTGHVPQLEAPDWTAETIRRWLAESELTSAASGLVRDAAPQ
jgi:pimeloyl-ACP methyl ester carboxylesterase